MADRIDVTTQPLNPEGIPTGTAVTLTAPTADGDVVDAGRVWVRVTNSSEATVTVTVLATQTVQGLAVANLTAAVAAGATEDVGPLPVSVFGQPAGANASGGDDQGRVYINYSAVASVTRAAVSS
jgi:hypothetical protein